MAAYADWVEAASIHLDQCPRVAVLHAIKQCVIEFCMRSKVWTFEHDDIAFNPDDPRYTLDRLPVDSTICHVWSLNGRNYCCTPDEMQRFNYEYPNAIILAVDRDERTGAVRDIEPSVLKPFVSLKPMQKSLDCPDFIADDYFEVILNGAVAYLQMQPSKKWSSPNTAAFYQSEFLSGIDRAIKRMNEGFNRMKPTNQTKPHYL